MRRAAIAARRALCSKPVAPGVHKSSITSRLWEERAAAQAAGGDRCSWEEGEHKRVLVEKAPGDSAVSAVYRFGSDATLRDQYLNPWGGPRFGVLFEDMDALAGNVAFKHADDGDPATRPLLLVTASVDQISLLRYVPLDSDLRLSGKVVWVGRSSMQIRIELGEDTLGEEGAAGAACLASTFTFVARDQMTGKAARINPLVPATAEDRSVYAALDAEAQAAKAARSTGSAEEALKAAAARASEQRALLVKSATHLAMPSLADGRSMLTRETLTHNALICQVKPPPSPYPPRNTPPAADRDAHRADLRSLSSVTRRAASSAAS